MPAPNALQVAMPALACLAAPGLCPPAPATAAPPAPARRAALTPAGLPAAGRCPAEAGAAHRRATGRGASFASVLQGGFRRHG